jgi:hypothetical protein
VTLLAPLGASKVSGCIRACAAIRRRSPTLWCTTCSRDDAAQVCSRAGACDEAQHYFEANLYARQLGFERVTRPPRVPGVTPFFRNDTP